MHQYGTSPVSHRGDSDPPGHAQGTDMNTSAQTQDKAIAKRITAAPDRPHVVYRRMGDRYLLVEYGDIVMDVNLRVRIYSLQKALREEAIAGIEETNPGVRSLLIKYDSRKIGHADILKELERIEYILPHEDTVEIQSRVVRLPMAFNDRWCRDAVKRYSETVRETAPYVPDNVDFVRRCNGLSTIDQVGDYLARSEILVIGLGDVYLGAPCAIPLDPRYRLCAPKYNPARTYTPEGAVGIGGACICIYPMESPGGYQLVGRTLPIWNTRQKGSCFADAPWLLRNFDRIAFEYVTENKLETIRARFLEGDYSLSITDGVFKIREYNQFTRSVQGGIDAFRKQQDEAIASAMVGY